MNSIYVELIITTIAICTTNQTLVVCPVKLHPCSVDAGASQHHKMHSVMH